MNIKTQIKTISLYLIIIFLAIALYIVNVRNEQNFFRVTTCVQTMEPLKVSSIYNLSTNLVDKTTNIIIREGNINPNTARNYALWIHQAGLKHRVDPILILSVMSVESKFKANAKSPTGPIGLLQIAHTHHKEKSTKSGLYDPKTNIFVGAQILREYKNISKTETEALLRYNGSLHANRGYAKKVLISKYKYEKEIKSTTKII